MYFYATFTQHDGVHEHIDRVVLEAESDEAAEALCDAQLYDCGAETDSIFSYGDGETAVSEYSLRLITREEYEVLEKFISSLATLKEFTNV